MEYAKVAINLPAKNIFRQFTYHVPEALDFLGQGWRVVVPFGQQLLEGLNLPLDIGAVGGGGAVRCAEVGKNPLDPKVLHGEDLNDLLQVMAGLTQAVHPGVNGQVDRQGFAGLAELHGVGEIHCGLG